jgi:glycerol-3-phosphate cytidylyltransferase-like family protein
VTIVARDTNVIKFKKIAPENDENLRLKNLKDSNIADIVELGDEKNPTKWIEYYNPSVICLGYDQKGFLQDVSSFLEKRNIIVKKI